MIDYAGLNTNRPVVVQVSQLVCQALEVIWCQPGAVLNHVVMGWGHCSLTNRLADKEEVIPRNRKNQYELTCPIKLVQRRHKIQTVFKSLSPQVVDQFFLARNTLTRYIINSFITILCV